MKTTPFGRTVEAWARLALAGLIAAACGTRNDPPGQAGPTGGGPGNGAGGTANASGASADGGASVAGATSGAGGNAGTGGSGGSASAGAGGITSSCQLEQYLPSFAAVADPLDLMNPPGEELWRTASTLQGLVNRTQPRIYVRLSPDEDNEDWLSTLNVTTNPDNDVFDLISKYRDEIAGLVIFDPNLEDSTNVAVSVASVLDSLVVSPTTAETLSAAPYSLPVLMDLRGQFTTRLEAYQWLKDNYWNELSRRALFSISPSIGLHMIDYVMAQKGYLHFLEPNDAAEKALYDSLLADLPVNAPVMGWWHEPENGGELAHVRYLAEAGHPALGFDYFANASVFGGASRTINVKPPPPKPTLENKIYVTLFMSDGDNLQAVEHAIRNQWDDPMRGSVPIGWTLSPALVDVAPNILNWFWENATDNDNLVAGPSGLAYTYPNHWPSDDALTVFAQYTGCYLAQAGMNVITIWDDSGEVFTGNAGSIYSANMPNLLGVAHHTGTLKIEDGLAQTGLAAFYATSETEIVDSINASAADFDGSAPKFIAAQGVLWNHSPTSLHSVMTTLQAQNSNYVFVRPDHFFELVHEAADSGISTLSVIFEAEGERMSHAVGRADADGWSANPSDDAAGYLMFGPYVNDLPTGNQKAIFRMQVDDNAATDDLCVTLEVSNYTSGALLGSLDVHRQDWTSAGTYQDFEVVYTNATAGDALEFRVHWKDAAYVLVDRVQITDAPP